ncbi:putative RNA-directed DNA polymerase from transposon BS, partial [Orchesella cincta]
MGFPPGEPVVDTIGNERAERPADDNYFYVKSVSQLEVCKAWKGLRRKLSKRCDTCGISKFFLDKIILMPAYLLLITTFVNLCFEKGEVPDMLKVARVVPIPKKSGAILPSDFRPISLTSILLLLLEKIYYNKLVGFLEKHKIMSPSQFGCRKHHSTELAMITATDYIRKLIDSGLIAVIVSIDLRKAFDSVKRGKLLRKLLKKYKISDYWLRSYLANRKQFVEVNGKQSEIRDVLIGVPAGSILGPILFALYVNDLPDSVKSGITVMFVDDSNLVFGGHPSKLGELELKINADMRNVCSFLEESSLVINSDKTKMLTVSSSRRCSLLDNFCFDLNGFKVENSSTLKCLGITLDRKLNFRTHMDNVARLCYARMRALYTIRAYLNEDQLRILSQSLVYSMINYMVVVYGVTSAVHLKVLKRVVRTLARLVFSLRKYDKVSKKMYEELEWLVPQELCQFNSLCVMFKLSKETKVDAFNEYFVEKPTHGRDTRNN